MQYISRSGGIRSASAAVRRGSGFSPSPRKPFSKLASPDLESPHGGIEDLRMMRRLEKDAASGISHARLLARGSGVDCQDAFRHGLRKSGALPKNPQDRKECARLAASHVAADGELFECVAAEGGSSRPAAFSFSQDLDVAVRFAEFDPYSHEGQFGHVYIVDAKKITSPKINARRELPSVPAGLKDESEVTVLTDHIRAEDIVGAWELSPALSLPGSPPPSRFHTWIANPNYRPPVDEASREAGVEHPKP